MTTLSEATKCCSDCGAEFKPYHHKQKRCPDCIQKQGGKYKGHKLCTCKTCGKQFQRSAPNQRYCSKVCSSSRMYHLERAYGLTLRDFQALEEKAGHCCEICGGKNFDMSKKFVGEARLCVDHCHTTGNIRGLLCHNCNRALGLLQDNPNVVERARQYLVERAETIRKE